MRRTSRTSQAGFALPYVSFPAFEEFLGACARQGLPARLREDDFPDLSRSVFLHLLPSLEALLLIDRSRQPTELLRSLVATIGHDEYAQMLGELIDVAFAPLGVVDLSSATPSELISAFAASGHGEGTLKKARTFYLAANRRAGRVIGPRLEFGLRQRRRAGDPVKRSARLASDSDREQRLALAQLIVAKMPALPEFDPRWSARDRAQWFSLVDRLTRFLET